MTTPMDILGRPPAMKPMPKKEEGEAPRKTCASSRPGCVKVLIPSPMGNMPGAMVRHATIVTMPAAPWDK